MVFWLNDALHYNKNKPKGDTNCYVKSLETRQGYVKRDVPKQAVAACDLQSMFFNKFDLIWGVKGLTVTWSNLVVTWKDRHQVSIIP